MPDICENSKDGVLYFSLDFPRSVVGILAYCIQQYQVKLFNESGGLLLG
jgi:hypothetical protein